MKIKIYYLFVVVNLLFIFGCMPTIKKEQVVYFHNIKANDYSRIMEFKYRTSLPTKEEVEEDMLKYDFLTRYVKVFCDNKRFPLRAERHKWGREDITLKTYYFDKKVRVEKTIETKNKKSIMCHFSYKPNDIYPAEETIYTETEVCDNGTTTVRTIVDLDKDFCLAEYFYKNDKLIEKKFHKNDGYAYIYNAKGKLVSSYLENPYIELYPVHPIIDYKGVRIDNIEECDTYPFKDYLKNIFPCPGVLKKE